MSRYCISTVLLKIQIYQTKNWAFSFNVSITQINKIKKKTFKNNQIYPKSQCIKLDYLNEKILLKKLSST